MRVDLSRRHARPEAPGIRLPIFHTGGQSDKSVTLRPRCIEPRISKAEQLSTEGKERLRRKFLAATYCVIVGVVDGPPLAWISIGGRKFIDAERTKHQSLRSSFRRR